LVVTERQFILSLPFEDSKQWGIKLLENLRRMCSPCYHTHLCISRKNENCFRDLAGKSSITSMIPSWSKSPRVRGSLRLGRKTVRMYSAKISALIYAFALNLKMKSVAKHAPLFSIVRGWRVYLEKW
jgi:hypothetical protein